MNIAVQSAAHVLIAEDSAVYRKLFEFSFAGQPYELRFVNNGAEAINQSVDFQPDILITDWLMPDVSGVELCRRIRNFGGRYTYIILVSQNVSREHIIEGLDAGADDYIAKPFDGGELLARIRVGCRVVQMSREIEAQSALLAKAARTDHLTGLPNRLAIEEFASRQLSAAIRHKFTFWAVMADLDKFKQMNDVYGHFAGDQVLQRFATILSANTRSADISGRLGGDEFLLVMTHGNKESIVETIERLRTEFADEPSIFNGHSVPVSASFGIAGFDGTEECTLHDLLARADRSLTAAKAAGRNQVRAEERSSILVL